MSSCLNQNTKFPLSGRSAHTPVILIRQKKYTHSTNLYVLLIAHSKMHSWNGPNKYPGKPMDSSLVWFRRNKELPVSCPGFCRGFLGPFSHSLLQLEKMLKHVIAHYWKGETSQNFSGLFPAKCWNRPKPPVNAKGDPTWYKQGVANKVSSESS